MRLYSMPPSAPTPSRRLAALLLLVGLPLISHVTAVSFQAAPSSNLDLSGLGQVALAGYFDSFSLYDYVGQDENGISPNGSQSLLARFPNGAFTDVQSSDAYIESMCSFVAADGTLNGVVVGGNFTSIGGQEVQAVALFDPVKNTVTPLPGLSGQVYSVYCDNSRQTVYVGGMFTGADSTNAIAWIDGWTNLPFAGFNGPVMAVNKLPNGNMIFAGHFTAIGNMTQPHKLNAQVVNVGSAKFTIDGENTNPRFGKARNLICATPDKVGPGTSFVLADDTPGGLQADFAFGFEPSMIRLLNSQVEGYGTKVWRFTAYPDSILNFTYFDENGKQSCTNECPLANNGSYQDFYFVNQIGMDSFRIDISDWWGKGGGLSGIELFQNDIFSYAIDEFNEPHCSTLDSGSSSTTKGKWQKSPEYLDSLSQYLTTQTADTTSDYPEVAVTFKPNIVQSGNYTIYVNTPGCIPDGTCATRGVVNIAGQMASSTSTAPQSFFTTLYQNQDYDKYDIVYIGYVEASSESFQPTVTLYPTKGQDAPLTVVAQRIQFELMSTIGGGELNGLFEFNPNEASVSNHPGDSVVDLAGSKLSSGAVFNALAVDDSVTYAAGGFSSDSIQNILSITADKSSALANGGLNDVVQTLWYNNGILYAGGNFTSTADNEVSNLNNVAAYDASKRKWSPLGTGVNGMVYDLVPFNVNVSNHGPQEALAVSGYFNKINAFGKHGSHSVLDVAVWIPSLGNWLQNLDPEAMVISGQLNAYTSVPGMAPIWSGGVDSQSLAASNVIGLTESLGLQSIPITFAAPSNSPSNKRKRATSKETTEGVSVGMFYDQNNLNLTILGGHFTATATNGQSVSNLVVVNGNQVTGLDSDSSSNDAIFALDSHDTSLFAGGSISGGLLVYDLKGGKLAAKQPPSLSGREGTVYSVATRAASSSVYVGGSFTSAGSLSCPALCYYDTSLKQWQQPGSGLSSSSTVNVLEWTPSDVLILAGELKLRGKQVTMAHYDAKNEKFTAVENSESLPGPITAYTAVDSSFTSAFVAGKSSSDGSTYLASFDGDSTWTTISGLGKSSVIEGVQILSLNSDHDSTSILASNQALLVSGKLQLSKFGDVSAALFDGSKFTPFALSTLSDGSPGTISQLFVQNTQNLLVTQESYLALGLIVLIGLACALGTVFLIVVIGILVERVRRRREGYIPAPTGAVMYEKSGGGKVGKITPEKIFGGVGPGGGSTAGSRL